MDAKTTTTTQMLRGWFPGLDGKQQCACACWMAVRTELHLKSLSASETRRQFGVFFLTRVDTLPSHKQIKR